MSLKIVIAGSSGRMGRELLNAVHNDPHATLHGSLVSVGSAFEGQNAGMLIGAPNTVTITSDLRAALTGADVLIDFTRPEGTLAHLALCRTLGVNMVIGTTGFSPEEKQILTTAAQDIALVMAPNMSVGVNVMLKLLQEATRLLADGYDIEIVEMHHRHKVDAPSGTALRLGEVIADTLGRDLDTCAVYGREGVTGARDPKTIGFATLRGGDVVGDHTVVFAGVGERIEITHKASSRATFAQGALRAAHFIQDKKHGIFDMQDVLNIQ